MTNSISVVVCTIGRAKELEQALFGLSQQSHIPEEVVLVIGPDKEDYSFLGKHSFYGLKIKSISINQKNLSWARNVGIQNASSEFILFMDDDAIPEPRLIENYQNAINSKESNFIGGFCRVGGYLTWQNQRQVLNRNFEIRQPREPEKPPLGEFYSPMGANFLVKRSLAIENDGFDNYLLWWGDEADFALRMNMKGTSVEFASDAIVHHFQASSELRDKHLVPKSQYIPWRSLSYLAAKHTLNYALASNNLAWRRIECRLGLQRLYSNNSINSTQLEAQLTQLDTGIRHGFAEGIRNKTKEISGFEDVKVEFERDPSSQKKVFVEYQKRNGFSSTIFISREAKSDQSGGITNWIHSTAAEIAARGHSAVVVCDGTNEWNSKIEYRLGYWYVRVGREELYFLSSGSTSLPNDLQTFGVAARNLVTRLDPGFGFTAIVVPIFEGIGSFFLEDTRLVSSLHTSTEETLLNHPQLPFNSALLNYFKLVIGAEEKVLQNSPRLLANSKAIIEKYNLVDDKRVKLIPHGVSNYPQSDSSTPLFEFQSKNPVCTFLGRWEPRKGAGYLPAIINRILSSGINVVIAGADPFQLRSQAIGILIREYPQQLKVLDVITESEKWSLFNSSDVILIPSTFESFGLVAAEALIGGAAICAFGGSGIEEVLSGAPHARLVPVGSTTEFAEAAIALANTFFGKPELRDQNKAFGQLHYGSSKIASSLCEYFS